MAERGRGAGDEGRATTVSPGGGRVWWWQSTVEGRVVWCGRGVVPCHRTAVDIINLATWLDMTYVIGVKDNQSCVKFMRISSTLSRLRCMKLRATCTKPLITFLNTDWCINLCYCHIVRCLMKYVHDPLCEKAQYPSIWSSVYIQQVALLIDISAQDYLLVQTFLFIM
jgi:hypothetical protein